jgi:hypothetical protein
VFGGVEQFVVPAQPPSARHVSLVVQANPSSQLPPMIKRPAHVPPVHTSERVHVLPSSQPVPSLFGVYTQPVAPHVPTASWHAFGGLEQVVTPAQPPSARHTSLVVQFSPSLQAAPVLGVPAQVPPAHASEVVHALPSSQVVPLAFGVYTHPPAPHVPAEA